MSDPNLDEFERLFPVARFSDHDVLAFYYLALITGGMAAVMLAA